jgi:predicted nucleic acid-binding protein
MTYFMDTSALVKIYHQEPGSEKALQIYKSEQRIVISDLARIEFVSTIHRRCRENEISLEALDVLVGKFQGDVDFRYEVPRFSSLVFDEAWSLIADMGREHPLRSLDGLQLAFFSRTVMEETSLFALTRS